MTLTENNVGDYADTLVLQARGTGIALDYSEASIDHLEALYGISDELLQRPDFPEAQRNLVIFYGGCYLGEVMARNCGGVWQFAENWFDSTLLFTIAEGGLELRPFQKIFQRVQPGGATEHSLVAYYEGLKERLAPSVSGR